MSAVGRNKGKQRVHSNHSATAPFSPLSVAQCNFCRVTSTESVPISVLKYIFKYFVLFMMKGQANISVHYSLWGASVFGAFFIYKRIVCIVALLHRSCCIDFAVFFPA